MRFFLIEEIHVFLVKNRIPYSTTFKELIELQLLNGVKLLEKHLMKGNLMLSAQEDSILVC